MDTSKDSRQLGRRPFRACVTVNLPISQAMVKANVLDISHDGVRLICAEPVSESEDALLTFRMRTRLGVQTEAVSGRVIQTRMDDDAWVVGFKFKHVLSQESTPLLARAATRQDTQS